MQSGRAQARKWTLEYERTARREPDPLMGWTSAEDTMNQVQLRFATMEEAVAFAIRNACDYTVVVPHERTEKSKSYADNFRYDRVRT